MSEIVRRNRPGTKAADMWNWELEDIHKMTGAFVVQEYLQELISKSRLSTESALLGADPSNIEKICEPPTDVDESVWQYEHIR